MIYPIKQANNNDHGTNSFQIDCESNPKEESLLNALVSSLASTNTTIQLHKSYSVPKKKKLPTPSLPSIQTVMNTSLSDSSIKTISKTNSTKVARSHRSVILKTNKSIKINLETPIVMEDALATGEDSSLNEKPIYNEKVTKHGINARSMSVPKSLINIPSDTQDENMLLIPETHRRRSRSSADIDTYFADAMAGTIRSLQSLRKFGF